MAAWTSDELRILKRDYPHRPAREIAEQIGRPVTSVYSKANSLGIRKSEEFLSDPERSGRLKRGHTRGCGTRFKSGHMPWNKGLRYNAGGRSAQTRFKKGGLYGKAKKLVKPVGFERISDDGIRQRKIRMDGPPHRRWKSVHSILWEEHHGPIPDGHVVIFVNGDSSDIRIDNLTLVSRPVLLELNRRRWNDLPPALRPAAISAARLAVMTRQKERGK